MADSFLPRKDAELLAWSVNFNDLIEAAPTDYGLTAAQATAYTGFHNAYAAAYQTAVDPSTRTKGTVAAKNDARTALKADARLLARIIEGQANVTNQQKIDLGLNVRKTPTPIPPPADAPNLDIVARFGTTVKIKLHDGSGTRRGKPVGVNGATVFTYVGNTPPVNVEDWKFEGNTGKTILDIEFDPSLAPGSTVWFTAFWFNERKQSGPGCAPVSAIIAGGAMAQAA